MSRSFDDSIRYAADALVAHRGLEAAVKELNERRVREDRAAEALAYVKREYEVPADA
jgi:hypothetical protein